MNWAHFLPLLAFVVIPSAFALFNYQEAKKTQPVTIKKFSLPTIINSAVLFALAYNTIFFIQELFLVLGKNWIGLNAYLYHNNHSWEGSHPKEALMQGAGAAAIFIFGILFLFIHEFLNKRSWIKVFMLWLAFNGLLQSLPQFATAKMAADTDTGQAFYYLGFSEPAGWMITISSYVLMMVALIWFSKLLLQFSPNNDSSINRFHYMKNAVLLAVVTAVAFIIPFRIPPANRIMAVVFLALLCVPVMMGFGWRYSKPQSHGNTINEKILIAPIILLILLLLFSQLYLAKGILFTA